jgi:plastocyanin
MIRHKKNRKMKKSILLIMLFSIVTASFSATTIITNSGTTFSPSDVTINLGDNVTFNLASSHNAIEVSQATYNAKGTTPLAGGFSVPFGGGTVSANLLSTGIHYFVCTSHVSSSGMRGTITVLNTTGIAVKSSSEGISVYPNPSNGNFQLKINNPQPSKEYELGIYNVIGAKVFAKSDLQQQSTLDVDIADLPKGTYFVKLFDGKETFYRKIVVR